MSIFAIQDETVSSNMMGSLLTKDENPPIIFCCDIWEPAISTELELQFPGSTFDRWSMTIPFIDLPAGGTGYSLETEFTVSGGNTSTLDDRREVFVYKLFTQSFDWRMTVTDTNSLAETTIEGHFEASLPETVNGQFTIREPKCLENFPRSICDAIGSPVSVGLPERWGASSTFTENSTSCAGLGYESRDVTEMPEDSPGVSVGSTCTYR